MTKLATLPQKPAKPRPPQQRIRIVENELERTRVRIRTLDTLSAVFILAASALAYVLIVIAMDYWLRLGDGIRQFLWAVAGAAAVVHISLRIIRPLMARINPYYAARIIEKSAPESRNGVINWLDLRDQPINPHIRDALSRRAVQEIDSADLDEALPTRKPMRIGVLVALAMLGIIIFAWFLPDQIGSLVQRALFPFKSTIIPTKTRLEVLMPFEEPVPDVDPRTLPIREIEVERGLPVGFTVLAHGVVPEEVLFKYQTAGDKTPLAKTMRQDKRGESNVPWKLALSSSDIPAGGFEFWFEANDGSTRRFQLVVTTKTPPSVSDLHIKLTYPKYTNRRPSIQGMGPIRALEGTQVDLTVTADRPVAKGELNIIQEQLIGGRTTQEKLPEFLTRLQPAGDEQGPQPELLTLEKPLMLVPKLIARDGKQFSYTLEMVTPENRTGISPHYPLEVDADLAPRVEIKKVNDQVLAREQDEIEVQANSVLAISGTALDDIAVGEATLRLKAPDGREIHVLGGAPLEKNVQKATGFAPPPADYLLKLDLAKLTYDAKAEPAATIKFTEGGAVDLIVEARDTAEPQPHVGASRALRLKIKGQATDQQRQEQEQQAQQQEQKHEEKKQERQQGERKDQQPGEKQQGEGEKQPGEGEKKPGEQQPGQGESQPGEKKPGEKQPGESRPGENQKQPGQSESRPGEKKPGEAEKQPGEKKTGEGEKQPAEKKPGEGEKQPGEKKPEEGEKQPGEKRTGEGEKQPGEKKTGEGEKQPAEKKPGEGEKQPGEKKPGEGEKQPGEKKSGENEKQPSEKRPGEGEKQSGVNRPGEGEKQTGEKKPGEGEKQPGEKKSGEEKQPGEKKPGTSEQQPGEKKTGEGEKQPGEKKPGEGQKQPGEKKTGEGEKQPGEKKTGEGEKQPGEKKPGESEKQPGEKQPGEKKPSEREMQPGEKKTGEGEKQPGEKKPGEGEKQPGEKNPGEGEKQPGEKQPGEKKPGEGEKQPSQTKPGDKQPGEKKPGEKQPGEGEKQSGEKQPGEKQPGEPQSKQPGGPPDDRGDLSELMDRVANPGQQGQTGKPAEVDPEAAKKSNLALDTLAEKLRRGDIDRKLSDKLKELGLTKEQAQKLVENKLLERKRGTGSQVTSGPGKTLTGNRQRTDGFIDPAADVPDELSSSYRSFTQKRNQLQPKK